MSEGITFKYYFPWDFAPNQAYLPFLQRTFSDYQKVFGPLEFTTIKVGAIKRGRKDEDSGSPAGNLILFSRTALGDEINQESLKQIGITQDISDALRKLIIAHELSHFWFGAHYFGQDGWMVEGIPQYLGLIQVFRSDSRQAKELLKLFKFMDQKGEHGAIPHHPFGDGDLFIKAYYQGPLALYKIGSEVGHDKLIQLIHSVFSANSNPDFSLFEKYFLDKFPSRKALWSSAWRIEK